MNDGSRARRHRDRALGRGREHRFASRRVRAMSSLLRHRRQRRRGATPTGDSALLGGWRRRCTARSAILAIRPELGLLGPYLAVALLAGFIVNPPVFFVFSQVAP